MEACVESTGMICLEMAMERFQDGEKEM